MSQIRVGTVGAIAATKKTYRVLIDGDAPKICRPLHAGVQTAYEEGDRVVVVQAGVSGWLIVGRYDQIPEESTPFVSANVDEYFALEREDVLAANQTSTEPDFRPVDSLGQKEDPLLSGDAILENRAKVYAARSYVKVFSFGDIFEKASDVCWQYFRKKTGWIAQQAISFVRRTYGFEETIITNTEGTATFKTTYKTTVKIDALSEKPDYSRTVGYIPPVITTSTALKDMPQTLSGERTVSGNFVVELDHDTNTARLVNGAAGVEAQLGSFTKENLSTYTKPVMVDGVPVTNGLHFKIDQICEITIDASTGTVLIEGTKYANQIKMAAEGITLKRGSQFVSLTDTGLVGEVQNYTMTVAGQSTETAAFKSIQAAEIRLN